MSKAEFDPVCKLNGSLENLDNDQSFRLCAIVMTSPFFKKNFEYPRRVHYKGCFEEQISFRTKEGKAEATDKLYREFMLHCYVNIKDVHKHVNRTATFYISRAYNPNQVFIYSQVEESMQRKFYLEYLNTDVSIVHEPYNLGNIEIWIKQ